MGRISVMICLLRKVEGNNRNNKFKSHYPTIAFVVWAFNSGYYMVGGFVEVMERKMWRVQCLLSVRHSSLGLANKRTTIVLKHTFFHTIIYFASEIWISLIRCVNYVMNFMKKCYSASYFGWFWDEYVTYVININMSLYK